jgi:DNA (cytosine-5)-methyltransferase 1
MRELCRLQTFPDDVTIEGKHSSVHKQLGNAVPSLLAEVIGREVRCQFLDDKVSATPTLLPPDRGPPPAAEKVASVPKQYRQLVGSHEGHPGTGKGNRAKLKFKPAA